MASSSPIPTDHPPLNIRFTSETAAQPLTNSKGKEKNRIQIIGADSPDEQPIYAIAAQSVLLPKIPTGKLERLKNWLNRVVVLKVKDEASGEEGYVKVNKFSLKKRLQLTSEELTKFEQAAARGAEDLTTFVHEKVSPARENVQLKENVKKFRAEIDKRSAAKNVEGLKQLITDIPKAELDEDMRKELVASIHYNLSFLIPHEEGLIHVEEAAKLGNTRCQRSIASHYKNLMLQNPDDPKSTEYLNKAIHYNHLLEDSGANDVSSNLGKLYAQKAERALKFAKNEDDYQTAAQCCLEAANRDIYSAMPFLIEKYKKDEEFRKFLKGDDESLKQVKSAGARWLNFYHSSWRDSDTIEFGKLYIDYCKNKEILSEILRFSDTDARKSINGLIELEQILKPDKEEDRLLRADVAQLLDQIEELLENNPPFTKQEFNKARGKEGL